MKDAARAALVGLGVVVLAPVWLSARFGAFAGMSELMSLVPGRLGIFLRRSFYRMTLERCALDVHVGFGTTFAHRRATIGRGVYIGNRCTLGMVGIHDHVTIGSNVDVLSGRHQHFTNDARPVQEQGGRFTSVTIGRNAWLGNSSVIMADVGEQVTVGAGSVVVHAVNAGTVVVGNPARAVGTRAAA